MDRINQSFQSPDSIAVIPYAPTSGLATQSYYPAGTRYPEMIDDGESGNSLLEYGRILGRHKKTIILWTLAGILAGFLIGIPMPNKYRVYTTLEVVNLNEDFMNMKDASPTTSTSNEFDTSEEQTQAKLLQSQILLDRVFQKLDPGGVLTRKGKMATTGWRSWLHQEEPEQMTEREVLLAKAARSLDVRPTPKTRVLEITVDSRDPQIATDFSKTLVNQFIQLNLEARLNASNGTAAWLDKEMEDARARLRASENALQSYARDAHLIFTDADDTNIQTEKLQEIQQALSKATSDRIAKEARFQLAKASPPDSLADVLNDQTLQDDRAKVNDARRQLADLSTLFSPEFGKVKRAQAELTTLEEAYKNGRADVLKSIENDYHQALSNEQLLLANYNSQTEEVTRQSGKEIQYNILKRELESSRLLYDTMLQQTKQAAIASAMRASNVRVADPPDLPDHPLYPNFLLNSAIGFLLGLFSSIAFVIYGERADRTLQQPGDVKLWTNLAELGTIPDASRSVISSYRLPNSIGPGRMSPAARNTANSVELLTLKQKPSIAAEAFRSTLTSIFFVGENGSRPRVIAFTSASPADGKTTVVSNLAIATAEIQHKVLIIDADLRRPRLHNIYSLSNERGLSDLLSEQFSEVALAEAIQTTSIPGVHVLTGGSPTQSAAHLLYSPNYGAILNKLRNEYDMILVDTPPSMLMTDARVAARLADAVILVVRAGKTTRDSLIAMKSRFEEDRIRILGTILNDWNPKRSTQNYYSTAYGRYAPYHASDARQS